MKLGAHFTTGRIVGGRYRIDATVGRGKSAIVFRACDLSTDTIVALKVLDPFLAQDGASVERFRREVQILRALDHPAVVKVFDFFREADSYIIVMQYVDGISLRRRIRDSNGLPIPEVHAVLDAIAGAVEACHGHGVLHRDLKPHNILIGNDGVVKLVDFGIAKIGVMSDLTKTGTAIGTPEYMAPELFSRNSADQRADIYGVGAIAYEMLTGRPPGRAGNLSQIVLMHMQGTMPPIATLRADVPPWLSSVVTKCLRVDPDQRYQSCYELRHDLARRGAAVAAAEAASTKLACGSCSGTLVTGLTFCHLCGQFVAESLERGRYSLILEHPLDRLTLMQAAKKIAPNGGIKVRSKPELAAPAILLRKVSKANAMALTSELIKSSVRVTVAESLPNEFRMPVYAAAVAVLGLVVGMQVAFNLFSLLGQVAMSFSDSGLPAIVGAWSAAGGIVISSFSAWVVYALRTRAALQVRFSALRQDRTLREEKELMLKFVASAMRLRTPATKTTLARIFRSFLTLRRARRYAPSVAGLEALGELLARGFAVAEHIERCEAVLAASSLNELKEKARAVERRLTAADTTDEAERLINTKGTLERAFTDYREIQDAHADLLVHMNNLLGVSERLTMTSGEAAVQAAAELDRVGSAVAATMTILSDRLERGSLAVGVAMTKPLQIRKAS